MAQQVPQKRHAVDSCSGILRGLRGLQRDRIYPQHPHYFYGTQDTPTPLFIDNSAAISMGKVPQFSEKQKHIPIRICHLKECCADGMVELRPVPTRNELADIGTKALAWPALVRLRDVLFGNVRFSSLE